MKSVEFSLAGRVALVTGASRGIGEAIARCFAEYGATVILVSRKLESLEKVAADIAADGGRAMPVACHAGHPEEITMLMNRVRGDFGRLDILVNNAATNPYFGAMEGAGESQWDKTFDVNLKGPFFMIQQAVPLMDQEGGSIVNVSSVNGVRPAVFQGMYSITKAGLIMMTKAWARELAEKRIRVNALLPGLTDTRFSAAIMADEQINAMALSQIPLARAAQPREMAGAALYLASDAASFTTGACIVCDGGQLV